VASRGRRREGRREDALHELFLEVHRLVSADGRRGGQAVRDGGHEHDAEDSRWHSHGREASAPVRAPRQRGVTFALTRTPRAAGAAALGPKALLPKFMMWARPAGLKSVVNFGTSLPPSQV